VTDIRAMQRTTRLLLTATALVVAFAAAYRAAQLPLFDIHRIELREPGGLQHVSTVAVRAALRGDGSGALHGNFFTLKLDDARQVFETVPWVAAVSVRRVWPDRLIVTFTEHRALGTWGEGRLLSDAGVLFVANPAEADAEDELPSFEGPDRFATEAAQRFRDFSRALAPAKMAIDAVDVSERASWSLHTSDDVAFELGRDEPAGRIAQRLTAAIASWPLIIEKLHGRPARVDLRYANGFAVATAATNKAP
jgi:cell division protein FtsQ